MKKFALFAAVLMMAGTAFAEAKIGVISFREVLAKAPQREAISEKLRKEFQDRIDGLKKMETDVRGQQEKLQRDGATMSAQQQTEAKRNIEKIIADAQLKEKALKEDLQRREAEEMRALETQIMQAVSLIASRDGYSLVVSKETTPYFQPAMDITNQVVAAISPQGGAKK
ncbi:OmpH family outer membrane protein [Permianibacter aggregans]|uniref:Periplasmic chaperone for outer membrane proteins Skp n=1 Tax=Permianibacter aggregans TaxID=1510150 RepID=A0A4R6UTF4_9GAMM|nr:OmpH family outer membrane protein [Permianibacter aggregans]QGX38729.1 OmpH family outer membrane protein [Permianibacter aggregans]TDQ50530.1 periplasmic chaperone for outer membrane proteins Skp [Permianibacter aggregans]